MRKAGRILRLVYVVVPVWALTIIAQLVLIRVAMADAYQIAMSGEVVPMFYERLGDWLSVGTALASLATIVTAVIARYGLREVASHMERPAAIPADRLVDDGR